VAPLTRGVRPRQKRIANVTSLNYALYVCYAVAFVALPFALVDTVRATFSLPPRPTALQRWEKMPKKSITLFGGSIFLCLLISMVMSTIAQRSALDVLSALTGPHVVTVNGSAMANEGTIFADLKSVHTAMGHHSHPTKMFRVDVEAGGKTVEFNLGRDSQVPQEYWVYVPNPEGRGITEIGRIVTSALDDY
jgi:hypothetical protein